MYPPGKSLMLHENADHITTIRVIQNEKRRIHAMDSYDGKVDEKTGVLFIAM
jgi:hypothetical protein